MKLRMLILLSSVVYFFGACTRDVEEPGHIETDSCRFETFPQNLDFLNTEYDENSMNLTCSGQVFDLYFSTNNTTFGQDFDIVGRRIETVINPDTKVASFRLSASEPTYARKLLPKINTGADETGPFSFYSDSVKNALTRWYFFYANTESGDFEIRFAYTVTGDWEGPTASQQISGPYHAAALSFDNIDFYPTVDASHSRVYISTNRHKHYDIYRTEPISDDLVKQLQEDNLSVSKVSALSSYSEDKCPYIKGNLVVFSSNRPGGFGGYDLWYSVFDNGEWNEPLNFGSDINTGYDESGPSVECVPHSFNDLMIFSSDRPGGKGGFDFYWVGIPKMIK